MNENFPGLRIMLFTKVPKTLNKSMFFKQEFYVDRLNYNCDT